MKRYPLNPPSKHPLRTDLSGAAKLPERKNEQGKVDARPDMKDLLALSELITRSRGRRRHFLPGELFSEPAWEMLLALFRANAEGYRMSVSNTCDASGAPETTSLRWLDKLGELGMVTRRKNPLDARMQYVELQPSAQKQIQSYLTETWISIFARF